MLTPSDFHKYQEEAYLHILNHNASMLWLSMGLGKTVVTLTAIRTLQKMSQVKAVLVVAPLRVCKTVWRQEARKWSHLTDLRFSFILGDQSQRQQALLRQADIYLINYENIPWLTEQIEHYWLARGRYAPFDMIVWDEVSKMKNATSKRTASIARILPFFNRRVGLTGTPASNGLKDLHGQFLVVDNGARLGMDKGAFMAMYFHTNPYSRRLEPFNDTEARLKHKIGDITMQVDGSAVDRPPFSLNDIYVQLPPGQQEQYRLLEEEMFLELETGEEVEVFNAAAKTNKCLQFANGAVYTDPETMDWAPVHDAKLDALEEIVEETGDEPLLVAYSYRSDVARIKSRYPDAVNLTEAKGDLEEVVDLWNRGGIKMLIGHPASVGHGLNLQKGGHNLVWYGLPWSLDLYEQFNARVYRQGQKAPVICHRILTQDTLDEGVRDSLVDKATAQDGIRDAIRKYRATRGR